MKRISNLIGGGMLVLGLLAVNQSAKANLLVNGDFENTDGTWSASYQNSGFGAMIVPQNSTVIPGWTVVNGNTDWDQSGAFGLIAQHGSYYLDLTDDEVTGPAGMQQTFSTVANTTYHLSGWIGSSKDYNFPTTQPTITVNINGADVQTFTGLGYQDANHSDWQEFDLSFTAAGSSTTLLLQGNTAGSGVNDYIGLDDVSVTAVPETTTIVAGALLLLPFGMSAFRSLRRSRAV